MHSNSTNMINSRNGGLSPDPFRDSDVLEASDFSYFFDFHDKSDDFPLNMFYSTGLADNFHSILPTDTGVGQQPTGPIYNSDWPKDGVTLELPTSLGFDQTTEMSSSHIRSQASLYQTDLPPDLQYSNVFFQNSTREIGSQPVGLANNNISAKANQSYSLTSTGSLVCSPNQKDLSADQFNRNSHQSLHSNLQQEQLRRTNVDSSKQQAAQHHRVTDSQSRRGRTSTRDPNNLKKSHTKSPEYNISLYVLKCLTDYSFCVVDNFIGPESGLQVLSEVVEIERKGLFHDGRVVSQEQNSKTVRGDKIFWVVKNMICPPAIDQLVRRMDRIILKLSGSFPGKTIAGRTMPMIACYPGSGAAYMRHVDNSNQDGRLITCLYYLNQNWNVERDGGALRLYPSNDVGTINIEPLFDRLLLFWSDCRNPHEVMPSFRNRYAITVWYLEGKERKAKLRQCENEMTRDHTLTYPV